MLKPAIEQENKKTPQKRQSYDRKHAKKALVNRKGLKNIDKTSIDLRTVY